MMLDSRYEMHDGTAGTATRAACSPHKEIDEDESLSSERSCRDVQLFHVGRHGHESMGERRANRQAKPRRSRRASPTGILKLKHMYRSYNDDSQDYEDDRERVISFSLEPTTIGPLSPREKLQVMVQSEDGSVFSLDFDELTTKQMKLASSLRSMSTTAGIATKTNNDAVENSQDEEDSKGEGEGDEDGGGGSKAIVLLNRLEDGYEKLRPYVRRLPTLEQRSLYKKRPDLSPAYAKIFKKKSGRESEPFADTDAVEEATLDPKQMRSCIFFDFLVD